MIACLVLCLLFLIMCFCVAGYAMYRIEQDEYEDN